MPTPQSENYPSPIDDSTAEDYSSEVLTELPEPAPAPTIEAPKIGKLRRIGRAILGRSAAIASVEDEPLETTETATETARPQDTWSDDEWGGWDDAPAATQEMAEQRYAKELPKFSDQVADASRTNTFSFRRYTRSYGAYGDIFNQEQPEVETMTEHDGLVDLQSFLEMAHARGVGMGVAKGMLENMSFIGEKEYAEATLGIGERWKTYLDENADNMLCIPLAITNGDERKSDAYLMDRVLNTFSDTELAAYKGRIVTSLDKIDQPPERTKILLLDDWMVSGTQMLAAGRNIAGDANFAAYAGSIEMQLITGSEFDLQHGFPINSQWDDPRQWRQNVPVWSYFKSRDAHGSALSGNNSHVTGSHSSVDYNFAMPIAEMVGDLNQASEAEGQGLPYAMPPLTGIVRAYRNSQPLVAIEPDGTLRRNPSAEQ